MHIRFKRTRYTRLLAFLVGDVFLLSLSLYLSFLVRFDWNIPWQYPFLLYIPVFVAIKIPLLFAFRMYSMSWSFAGVHEVINLGKALSFSSMAVAIFVYAVNPDNIFAGFPRSIVFLDYILSCLLVGAFRLLRRFYIHIAKRPSGKGKKTLIVGAGNAGELLARDIRRHEEGSYAIAGFVDDEEGKWGSFIQGAKVLGNTVEIPRLVGKFDIEAVLIAIPSATSKDMKRIMSSIRKTPIKEVKIIPSMKRIIAGNVTLSDVKEVSIEDIIGREQASLNGEDVGRLIKGKRVLVTGAGGSIGSEIVRQVMNHDPEMALALDIDETELFYLENEIRLLHRGTSYRSIVADVCDAGKVEYIFNRYRPEIVLHAAAYKHVPMMERYPEEAVRVNVFGTLKLLQASVQCSVEKFVLISTDKAVSPTSVMGSTKRVAEELVKFHNAGSHSKFMAVRFGNVVGSRGSVIPIFKNQILKGGPVTVTHKDMTRYFMSIPEAVALVLQAGAMGQGGEVFMLDMGEPVRILDVAREMIRLSGFEPDKDIPIVFAGVRQGEKLYEELLTPLETTEGTTHPKIFTAKNEAVKNDIIVQIQAFQQLLVNPEKSKIVSLLKEIIPAYTPSE
ncbi:MAG: polysaccharide biosynthesis protein [Syntrophorhabdus aromaticivorans]|uniref:Polysaccharide biosynthesis protein n=1 Tax=Syntrophorhabdus aromaticivorans TaxID=328301 RepID=A0A971M6J8_9BACT|nr:polysaccharide biosynthesis protein [Syntrophorhabdus aromaticivorans]